MIDFKRCNFIFYSIFFLSLVISTNAVCDYNADEFKIYSGNNLVATYTSDNFFVYSKANLVENPLKIVTSFTNDEDNCFTSVDDMKIKWFSPTSLGNSANSFTKDVVDGSDFVTSFTHIVSYVSLTGNINPTFIVDVAPNTPTSGSFSVGVDETMPSFPIFSYQPTERLLKSGDIIRINYQVSDLQSKLKKITISGVSTQIINFDSDNSTYTGLIEEDLTSSQTFRIDVEDKVGNKNNQSVSFTVDSVGPELISHSKIYTFDGQRKVTYSAEFKDTSFSFLPTETLRVLGDFSSFSNNDYSSVTGICTKQLDNISFNCEFNNIPIVITSTANMDIEFTSYDAIDNVATYEFVDEIFVDNEKPEILDFYTINTLGNKNIISSNDNNVSVYLKFKDDSASVNQKPTLVIDFEGIIAPGSFDDVCEFMSGNIVECIWYLNSSVTQYSGFDYTNLTYRVSITDYFQNTNLDNIIVQVDNVQPIFIESNFVETENIKDGILRSGEVVNFEVLFSDKYISSAGKYFVKGIFSNVNSGDVNKDEFTGSCDIYNSSASICEFNGITLRNGYVNTSVFFEINDLAGNRFVNELNTEIFAIGSEERDSFKDGRTFTILNPINRNRIMGSSVDAWFTGELEKYSGEEGIHIVNYAISGTGCNESALNPVIAIENSFYPDDTIIGSGNFEDDKVFNLKSELRDYPNAVDLNEMTMNCQLAVLKRDNTTIYPVEYVDINLVYTFYDLPGGDFVAQSAHSLLDKIAVIDETEEWFRGIYDIYQVLDGVCSTLTSASGLMTSVSEMVVIAQYAMSVLDGTFNGGNLGGALGKATILPDNIISKMLTEKDSPLKKMCDMVTCRNGGILKDTGYMDVLNNVYSLGGVLDSLCIGGEGK